MHRIIFSLGLAVTALCASGCTSLAYVAANTPALFGSYDRHADQRYGDDPRQHLDVYAPKNARDRPVVIFWYGGSWNSGRRGLYRFVGAALAERGFVTVIPDYRLYPQVKFPAFLDDGAQAIAWVQQHAREYGGDPQQIVLMGHSAGAHEAAMLAYDPSLLRKHSARPEWIVGLIGLSGPYALDPNTPLLKTIFAPPYSETDWQPLRFVTPHAPSTLLIHGTRDDVVSIGHAEKLRDALQANHVRVETEFYAGRGHADTVAAFSVARRRVPVLEQVTRFIESLDVHASGGSSASLLHAASPYNHMNSAIPPLTSGGP